MIYISNKSVSAEVLGLNFLFHTVINIRLLLEKSAVTASIEIQNILQLGQVIDSMIGRP